MNLSLEDALDNGFGRKELEGKMVLIWSGEHRLFWRGDASSYTPKIGDAGVYDFMDAFQKTKHCGPEKKIIFLEIIGEDTIPKIDPLPGMDR